MRLKHQIYILFNSILNIPQNIFSYLLKKLDNKNQA